MAISVFDLFKIGIGPSSSHTVGPMRAARLFAQGLEAAGELEAVVTVKAELFGSLGATGVGHGSDKAVILGLEGEEPETVDTDAIPGRMRQVREERRLRLLGRREIPFKQGEHLVLHRRKSLPYHPNGMRFTAFAADGRELRAAAYYSVGGGFVVDEAAAGADRIKPDDTALPLPVPQRGGTLALVRRARALDQRGHARERAGLAHQGRDPRAPARDLAGHAGLRAAGLPEPGRAAGGAPGPPPRGRAPPPAQHRRRGGLARPLERHGLG
jgi:L-serine dehydratase